MDTDIEDGEKGVQVYIVDIYVCVYVYVCIYVCIYVYIYHIYI